MSNSFNYQVQKNLIVTYTISNNYRLSTDLETMMINFASTPKKITLSSFDGLYDNK